MNHPYVYDLSSEHGIDVYKLRMYAYIWNILIFETHIIQAIE